MVIEQFPRCSMNSTGAVVVEGRRCRAIKIGDTPPTKAKPGPKEDRLVISEDPKAALDKLLKKKPAE